MVDGTQPRTFEIQLPAGMEAGAYANLLSVWHTGYEFKLDFCAIQPSEQTEEGVKVAAPVVARVRIPVGLIFEVLKALNSNMTSYEQVYGEIKTPGADKGEQQT